MQANPTIWAEHALTSGGWQSDISIEIDAAGRIANVSANRQASGILEVQSKLNSL